MLKKLRKRLAYQMFLISAIMVVVVTGSLLYVNTSFMAEKTIHAMEIALDRTVTINMKPFDSGYSSERMGTGYNNYEGLIITVVADENGNVLASNCNKRGYKPVPGRLAEDTKAAVKSDSDRGYISNGKHRKAYRFMKKNVKNGYKIVFADRSSEIETFRFLIIHYLIADVVVLLIVFIIVRYIAKKAVLPVDMAIKEQKRFIADASHELKTPLSVIMANVDLMASNPNSTIADNMKWINNTKSESERMSKLIHDMLLLAKTDTITAASEIEYKPLDFSDLVEGCAMTIEVLAF